MNKRSVCANCKKDYIEGDKYCRFCGAPMGSPAYIDQDYATIYGPMPVVRRHECEKCGYVWETELMIDWERFCPICGGPAPAHEEEDDRILEVSFTNIPDDDDDWEDE